MIMPTGSLDPIFIYHEVGDDYGRVEYVQHMGSDQTIIDAARVSFAADRGDKFIVGDDLMETVTRQSAWRPEKDPKLLRYLIKNEHWSPLEHTAITWHVVVPLFVRSQWHRHRAASYNEVSRRYTSEDIRFYEPSWFRPQAVKNKQASVWNPEEAICPDILWVGYDNDGGFDAEECMRRHRKNAVDLYEKMIEAGVSREQARMVLPQNMYTRFYVTMNLRNALAFIKLREDNHAQWEIYVAAKAMSKHLSQLFPETWEAWKEVSTT